jgi:ABC-type transport system involved in cytochrome c biogenesis permease subunit
MATDALPRDSRAILADGMRAESWSIRADVERIVRPLASLKLTVALFGMAIFLIFAGTLAQTTNDVWIIVRGYFRSWGVLIPLQVFLPPAFVPNPPEIPGALPFPGGKLIGVLMGLNLLAAHSVRFKIQASGRRLWLGLGVILFGMLLTGVVIATQQETDSLTSISTQNWNAVWVGIKLALFVGWLACAYRLFTMPQDNVWQRRVVSTAGVLIGALFCYLVYVWMRGDERPLGDSSMRILWQLMKATAAALVLLAGCWLVFRKRAGIVLLHSGIALIMANELVVDTAHVETLMALQEGETKTWSQDIRTAELAITSTKGDKAHTVIVPNQFLVTNEVISHEFLPFDIRIDEVLQNADLAPTKENPKYVGNGRFFEPVPMRAGTGVDTEKPPDYPAAYVTILDKRSGNELGTYLTSATMADNPDVPPDRVELDGHRYELSLRFARHHKPYSVTLIDVRKDDYPGTSIPKNFSSDIRLVDTTRGVDRKVKTWMNNPYRYGGDTFYQTGYHRDQRTGAEMSTVAIVSNVAWMIPYVGCMIVVTGLFAQFLMTLSRFLQRRVEGRIPIASVKSPAVARNAAGRHDGVRPSKDQGRFDAEPPAQEGFLAGVLNQWRSWAFPAAVVLLAAIFVAMKSFEPTARDGEMDLYRAGQIPILYQGRVKPLDSLARQSLCVISNGQTVRDRMGTPTKKDDVYYPAVRWLLDVIARSEEGKRHQIIRIDSFDVVKALDLEPRDGWLYSVAELEPKMTEFQRLVDAAAEVPEDNRSTFEKKMLEAATRYKAYLLINYSFTPAPLDEIMGELAVRAEKDKKSPAEIAEEFGRLNQQVRQLHAALEKDEPPRVVPDESDPRGWSPYGVAADRDYLARLIPGGEPVEAFPELKEVFDAYGRSDVAGFNRAVERYHAYLDRNPPKEIENWDHLAESHFNHAQPFYNALVLYVAAFVLSALGWLGWTKQLNRAAFWLLAYTLVYHTVGLIARIYISGRPPVTNLYSSAVFIGWGAVVFGLVFEMVYRLGLGNVLASIGGFGGLLIAHLLMTQVPADRGDTMAVLRAVLDTQFWLGTHVVCVTMGYAATFVAGIFGAMYVVRGLFTRWLTPEVSKEMGRMIYGTLCFALFFSFFGTVLGGLWADDSWGRFWGWDPKENGALIIVLWNALVLHARWDGMVKDRGMAVLAIFGNVVTAWSYFGVNELKVGLHSYGFTEGVLFWLVTFVVSQLALIGLGCIPKHYWPSFKGTPKTA